MQRSFERPMPTTSAPFITANCASANPMPDVEPVMTIVFPSSDRSNCGF